MSEELVTAVSTEAATQLCHLCGRNDGTQIPFNDLPTDLLQLLEANLKSEERNEQVCRNCVGIFSRAQEQLKSHPDIFADSEHALPTPLRMDAAERFKGRGVTSAFRDSGS